MANNNITEVVFILDKSGSMWSLRDDTIGGFNSMLDKQKKSDSKVLVSTILFDDVIKVVHDRVPIEEIKPMTREDYDPEGCTALLDAMGETIKHIKTIHKYAREEDCPAKTLFIITTDGMENASVRYSADDVKKLVESQKEAGWEFLFVGANIDAITTARSFGIDANRAVNYHSDSIGTRKAFETFSDIMCCFAAAPAMDIKLDEKWLDELKKDFEERKPDK